MKFKCPNCGARGVATELTDKERELEAAKDALREIAKGSNPSDYGRLQATCERMIGIALGFFDD